MPLILVVSTMVRLLQSVLEQTTHSQVPSRIHVSSVISRASRCLHCDLCKNFSTATEHAHASPPSGHPFTKANTNRENSRQGRDFTSPGGWERPRPPWSPPPPTSLPGGSSPPAARRGTARPAEESRPVKNGCEGGRRRVKMRFIQSCMLIPYVYANICLHITPEIMLLLLLL